MQRTTKLKLENLIRRLIKEETTSRRNGDVVEFNFPGDNRGTGLYQGEIIHIQTRRNEGPLYNIKITKVRRNTPGRSFKEGDVVSVADRWIKSKN